MSNFTFPCVNDTCPCRACQSHLSLTPAQRERRRRRKIIVNFVRQTEMMK